MISISVSLSRVCRASYKWDYHWNKQKGYNSRQATCFDEPDKTTTLTQRRLTQSVILAASPLASLTWNFLLLLYQHCGVDCEFECFFHVCWSNAVFEALPWGFVRSWMVYVKLVLIYLYENIIIQNHLRWKHICIVPLHITDSLRCAC